MKNTLRQVFHSPKFVGGFVIFVAILLLLFIYPLINPGNPLEMIGVGTFAKPGTYVSLYDAVNTETETLRLSDADDNRLAKQLSMEDRVSMIEWFDAMGIAVDFEITDTDALLNLWDANYDTSIKPKGMTQAKRNYYKRLHNALQELKAGDEIIIAALNEETGALEETDKVNKTDYVNVGAVANVKLLPLNR